MRKIWVAAALAGVATLALAAEAPVFGPWGLSLDYIDASVKPGEDFFRYSNGGWLKTATVPSDRTAAGVNLELDKGNEAKLQTIIAELEAKPAGALTAEERKLRDFYDAFEDVKAIDAAGLAPVKADLASIAKLRTLPQVAAFMASPATELDVGPIGLHITINQKKPSTYTARLYQSGLGMPDRDYYLRRRQGARATARRLQEISRATMLTFAGCEERRGARRRRLRGRDGDRQGVLGPRRPPRRGQGLQSDADLGAQEVGAAISVGCLLRRGRHSARRARKANAR